ncbi:hypothetical protein B9Z55_010259 [Caenorhabditis nigoni]|nr:hypothetical protein B9Z55_010259 [Caenorhabditis nigoni]
MAESAKNTLQMAQQQKAQREKMLQGQRQMQKFDDDSEPWQANLDTWRKKRKEKFGDRAVSENTVVTPKRQEEYASYQPRKELELAFSRKPIRGFVRFVPHDLKNANRISGETAECDSTGILCKCKLSFQSKGDFCFTDQGSRWCGMFISN